MSWVLDHVFVFDARGAPQADRLVSRGLLEGSRNQHLGQGTANRRFFFDDAMLEFLFVVDEAEARGPRVARAGLADRAGWRANGGSPFGVCLRPTTADAPLPFETWAYRPPYLPDGSSIPMGEGGLDEPLVFALPAAFAGADRGPRVEPHLHPAGARRVRGLHLTVPQAREAWSSALTALDQLAGISVERGPEHRLELELDVALSLDLGPELPVRLR